MIADNGRRDGVGNQCRHGIQMRIPAYRPGIPLIFNHSAMEAALEDVPMSAIVICGVHLKANYRPLFALAKT
jgi:hypothetical protein